MRQTLTILACLAFAVSLAAQQPPELEDSGPGVNFLTPTIDLDLQSVPLVVPEQFARWVPDRELQLPEGFKASVFAAPGLMGPRFMDWSPDGILHVANMKVNGGEWSPKHDTSEPPVRNEMFAQIVALPDDDNDGVADTALVVADRLWFPHSLQFYQGDLFVADMHQVVRLRDLDGDGFYENETVVIGDLPTGHHRTRTILFDEGEDKLYLSIGSSCDLCREADERRATILQSDPDGANLKVYARGLRNAIGMAFHPLTRQLWITGNGHDREGKHLPPEVVTIVKDGGFYGWPVAYGYQVPTNTGINQYADAILPLTRQDTLDMESMVRPAVQVYAHLAPMAIHFYHNNSVSELDGAALVAMRGGGRDAEGHKVVAIFTNPDGSDARVGDFVTGFEAGDDPWGKPVGLATDGAGNIYLSSDWNTNMIVRIEPAAHPTAVEEDVGLEAPGGFALLQNHPNPFNSSTTLRYILSRIGAVELSVYDMQGQLVRGLVQEVQNAGRYEITWAGDNDAGQPVATGTYLTRLQAAALVQTRKVMLIK